MITSSYMPQAPVTPPAYERMVQWLVAQFGWELSMLSLKFDKFDEYFLATEYGKQFIDSTQMERIAELRTAIKHVVTAYWMSYCGREHSEDHMCIECEWQVNYLLVSVAVAGTLQEIARD